MQYDVQQRRACDAETAAAEWEQQARGLMSKNEALREKLAILHEHFSAWKIYIDGTEVCTWCGARQHGEHAADCPWRVLEDGAK